MDEGIIPWMLALAFYIEAARRTWQVMFLCLPAKSEEPLAQLVKTNAVPVWFKATWLLVWVPVMLIGWALRKRSIKSLELK